MQESWLAWLAKAGGPLVPVLAFTLGSVAAQQQPPATPSAPAAPSLRPTQGMLAKLIDETLASEWKARRVTVAAPADDATWLRRLSIDLCGTIPAREEVAEFLADARPDKRDRKIDEYLADRACAESLSYLWGNALLSSATKGPERSRLRPWLEEAFAQGMPFADVTRELIAGTGQNDENGATSFALAYAEEIEALSAVTTRTFLGLQIQCAQCHDHPYDAWKQTDFEGVTAFFLNLRARKVGDMPPVFRLSDANSDQERRDQLGKIEQLLKRQRKEGDAPEMVEPLMDLRDELRGGDDPRALDAMDDERFAAMAEKLAPEQRERLERYRERQAKYRDARFLDGRSYQETPLLTRRQALAEWIVDPQNPWFAAATVNRLWGHFFGKGLTEPVDDLTGSKDAILPQLLATLAEKFEQGGTDLRFLMGALVRTRAYGLAASLTRDAAERELEERWFAAHPLRPFTAEQVLHALMRATAADERQVARARGDDFEGARMRLLEKFRYVFSDDEGGDSDSFAASIPQALFLMNGSMTNEEVRLRRSRMLEEILDESRSDRERLRQIFYATLGRPPTPVEAERLGRLMRGAQGGSKNGIEDLYWALLNATEFLTNH